MRNSNDAPPENLYRVYTAASIGAAIRHYRAQAGISQADLAESVGISPSYLSRLENGQETEQLRRIVAILKRLGVRMTLQKADW
ncbi:MAG: helix-turn-helix transcriptional regulator [Acidimicrobiales bacterium]